MDILNYLETELELSKSDALKVFYFIQEREGIILESIKTSLITPQ